MGLAFFAEWPKGEHTGMDERQNEKKLKLELVAAMLIFGSIGVFVKQISLPGAVIVQWRCLIGTVVLLALFLSRKEKIDWKAVRGSLPALLAAGIALAGSWTALFEAYQYTTVGMATMLYYCAPIAVFFLSAMLFQEKPGKRQFAGILAAAVGMVIINIAGLQSGLSGKGLVCGMASALMYAMLMISSRFVRGVPGLVSTWIQLVVAGILMSLYALAATGRVIQLPPAADVPFILLVGIVHTGIGCGLYFTAIQRLEGQTVSILSYIDPASALVFAFLFLHETLPLFQAAGALLIFGGALYSQLPGRARAS